MLFAMSDPVALAIVAVIGVAVNGAIVIATMFVKEKFDRDRATAAALLVEDVKKTAAEAAKDVVEVKETLATSTAVQAKQIAERFDAMDANVEAVHKATNGMKHELVEEVRKASFAQGVKSESDKQH